MVASVSTVEKIIEVVLKHIDNTTFDKIIEELETIPGNKSFRDTIILMREKFNSK